jgi:hypothetical protein
MFNILLAGIHRPHRLAAVMSEDPAKLLYQDKRLLKRENQPYRGNKCLSNSCL